MVHLQHPDGIRRNAHSGYSSTPDPPTGSSEYDAAVTDVLAGRDAERAALCAWLDQSLAGTPRVVLVSGGAGEGKTRILDQIMDDGRQRGATTVVGRAVEQEGAPPFWPWHSVLRALGAPDLITSATTADAPGSRFAQFDDTTNWFGEFAASNGGLVIGLDDVHVADVPTMRLLAHVAAGLRDVPILLALTHRPATATNPELNTLLHELHRLPEHRSISLRSLDRAAVAAVLGPTAPDATIDRVVELTGGNALFVSELARQIADGPDVGEVPDSLRALIGDRLQARTSACGEMLRTASVAGREFAAAVVANATGRPVLETLGLVDEAIGAGLLLPAQHPGRFRFTHLLVRDAIETAVPAAELPVLHRRIAEAIAMYEGVDDHHVHGLARHWDHAAILGDADIAAQWSERAAEAADRMLAWEEAVRLYDRALALSPPDTPAEVRFRRLYGAARGLLHSGLVVRAVERCVDAAAAAQSAGRPDLAADAALLVEGRGGSAGGEVTDVIAIAERALGDLDPGDHARQARLLGLLAALYFYVDPARCDELSLAAGREAELSGSPEALVAATRARQMVQFGPEHATERLELARRIGDAGRELRDASIIQWEPLWRIDALLELGRVHDAVGELPELRRLTESIRLPMARWHRMRAEAVLAAATGRWDDARHFGAVAREIHARQESHEAAVTLELALQTTIGLHIGFRADVLDDYDRLDLTRAPSFVGDMPTIVPLIAKLELDRREEAARDYATLRSVADWAPPPFVWLPIHTMRLLAAIGLGRLDDIEPILRRLAPHRGRHVAGGGGPIAYFGAVELHLGHGALVLGDLDTAIVDLRAGMSGGPPASAGPFEVRAATLLARALVERAGPDDLDDAGRLCALYIPRATELSMETSRDHLVQLATECRDVAVPLSTRELQVAALVARGMTNGAIAAELFVSPRTAQNHVQHILTKLGFSNRTQIATWHHDRFG